MLSESVLFTTILWVTLHSMYSYTSTSTLEYIVIPESSELTYGTALLLSNAGTSMGLVYTLLVRIPVVSWYTCSSLSSTYLFLLVQVREFSILGIYSNDSYTGTTMVSLSGLHSIHVLVGLVLVGYMGGTSSSLPLTDTSTSTNTVPRDMYTTMDYSYWHLVELVYIYIHPLLYWYYYYY
jgi:heme/copper-type cytochrome/quinol oxidase subunit 3